MFVPFFLPVLVTFLMGFVHLWRRPREESEEDGEKEPETEKSQGTPQEEGTGGEEEGGKKDV